GPFFLELFPQERPLGAMLVRAASSREFLLFPAPKPRARAHGALLPQALLVEHGNPRGNAVFDAFLRK
ncbi:MAG TPA: hypothetical protein VET30_08800, partial [Pseudoxanthomonas sp.]|nr:hypothetical protein [Pseudoxanthomonas sp.]